MENLSKRNILVVAFISVIALLVVFVLPSVTNNVVAPTASPESLDQEISLTQLITTEIDFGDQVPVLVTLEGTDYTAYSALQAAVESVDYELEVQQYDFGVFVQSINGYESTAEQSWIYFVNNESGMVAADQMQLQPGDTVSWRYVAPTEE